MDLVIGVEKTVIDPEISIYKSLDTRIWQFIVLRTSYLPVSDKLLLKIKATTNHFSDTQT